MAKIPQKELCNGVVWFPEGDDIPNVPEKLFALKNQCTGCNVCELACSTVHSPDNEINPQLSRLRIHNAPQKSAPQKSAAEEVFGFDVAICRHCGNPPPCAQVCPTDAFYYDPVTLAAVIAQDRCIQCMECVPACPFDAIFVAAGGELLKCDLCGGDPACVNACAARPEKINFGKQYARLPVLFHETQTDFKAIAKKKPESREEAGIMEAMLGTGETESTA